MPFEIHQDTFQPAQRTRFNPYLVAQLEEGAGTVRNARRHQNLKRVNLGLLDDCWYSIESNYLNHSRCFQNWQPIVLIKSTKQIAGKERRFHFLDSVRPSLSALV